jgi:hypothetical protein
VHYVEGSCLYWVNVVWGNTCNYCVFKKIYEPHKYIFCKENSKFLMLKKIVLVHTVLT